MLVVEMVGVEVVGTVVPVQGGSVVLKVEVTAEVVGVVLVAVEVASRWCWSKWSVSPL